MKRTVFILLGIIIIVAAAIGAVVFQTNHSGEGGPTPGTVRIAPTRKPTPTPSPSPSPTPTPTPSPTPTPTPTPVPRDAYEEVFGDWEKDAGCQLVYEEHWDYFDIKWMLTRDSKGNTDISFSGNSPFASSQHMDVDMLRFIDGKVYINVGDCALYFGGNDMGLELPEHGWLPLEQPAEFSADVFDFAGLFGQYADTIGERYDGTAFTDSGKSFYIDMEIGEMYALLKAAEERMDRNWIPPIHNMIASIQWKKYEKKLFSAHEEELLDALEKAGIIRILGRTALATAKNWSDSLILMVYNDYLGDVKVTEDEMMRVTRSGIQLFIGSDAKGRLTLDGENGLRIAFEMENAQQARASRTLLLNPYEDNVEVPGELIDLRLFGPIIKDFLPW